jgi:hypothetical protein
MEEVREEIEIGREGRGRPYKLEPVDSVLVGGGGFVTVGTPSYIRGSEMSIRGMTVSFPSSFIVECPSRSTVIGVVHCAISNVAKMLSLVKIVCGSANGLKGVSRSAGGGAII